MDIMQLFAAVDGNAMVSSLVWLLIMGVIFWVIFWAIGALGIPEPFAKVLRAIAIIFAVLIVINALLSMAGHPLIRF